MTTASKLWLGFGTLTALLVLSGFAILMRVRSIEGQVHEMENARSLSAETSLLEINVLDYALEVRAYLQSGEPRARQDAVQAAADVERHHEEYNRLATTERQRTTAARFAPMWQELKKHGQDLLNAENRQLTPEGSKRFYDLRTGVEKLLDDEMHAEAIENYHGHRNEALQDVKTIVGFAVILLIFGAVLAVLTSIAVGRSVVSDARVIAEQAERLRTTLASIGDAVITTDTRGRITNMNAVAESLTGWTNEEAKGRSLDAVFRIVNEETRKPIENPVKKVLAEGNIVGLANHTVLIAKDGTERVIDDSAAPIRCKEGEIVGCVLVFRDISERRRADSVLQESEARKTAMFETTLDCIISINHEGTIIEFNAAAERTFGHLRADVLGRELAAVIIPPAFRALHRQGLAHYLATGEGPVLNQRLELSALRADGTEFPVELTVTRIPVQGPPIFTAYLRDITERKRAEETLRASEQRFQTLFDLGPVAVFSCDRDGVIQNYNRRAAQLWGREPKCGDVSERFCGSLTLYHPDGRLLPHTESPIIQVLQTGVAVKDVEVFIERPNGSRIAVVVNFAPLRNEAGETIGAITAFHDITERKRLEDELRQIAADLSESDRRKNEFLAMLAHELRNPLAPIRNALQIMRVTGGNGQTVASASEMMDRQVGQMVRLVDDLLDVSRISRGKIELRQKRVELASVVHHAVEAARPHCESMDHELTVTLPPQPIYLNADPIRLAQVVGNLLNNACKFTESRGHIWLTVEVPPFSREREASADAAALASRSRLNEVTIRVRDTGIGIAADQLPLIFDMFTQVDTSLERSVTGLGIGLTLVKNLVEMHGGTVEAHSAGVGQGSEFVVRLPISKDEGGRMKDESADAPTDSSSILHPSSFPPILHPSAQRVLVVDDNRDSAESLAILLQLNGSETYTVYDGLEAVEAAGTFRPDVVLLDIGLPKLNGYEAARRIREQPWGKKMVLVALTGWGQDEDRQKSKEAGFDSHMVKPVDLAALTKLLAELRPRGDEQR